MENFILLLANDPLLYLGYAFAAAGTAALLLFFSGVFGGFSHLFTYSESADHMEHSRTRAMWGLYLCMVLLGIWETIRLLIGEAPGSSVILIVILLSPAWMPWVKGLLFGNSSH